MFFLEAIIEFFGDPFGVEGVADARGNGGGAKPVFFLNAEGQREQLLREAVRRDWPLCKR